MSPRLPGFNGARLVEARLARGLTGVALADLAGVTPQAVSQYENGRSSVRPEILAKMADTLNLPISYFIRDAAEDDAAPIFWRCRATASKVARERSEIRLVWLRDIIAYLGEYLDFPEINLPSLDIPANFRDITGNHIESAANAVRNHFGVGAGPMPDLLLELENHGIVVSRINMGAEKQDGFSQISSKSGVPFVVLGRDKASAVRQRFDAGHELFHLLAHQTVENKRLNTKADNMIIEDQAHHFASALLLPEKQFMEELWAPTLDAMLALKDRWKVSVAAMIKRCQMLGVLDQDGCQRAWINYNRRGWRGEEPLDNKIEKERPRLLRRSIEMILAEKLQSVSQIVSALSLNARDIEELCDLDPGLLSRETSDAKAMPKLKTDLNDNVVNLFRR